MLKNKTLAFSNLKSTNPYIKIIIIIFLMLFFNQVSAINRAGQGKPTDPTAPLLVKALNAPPKIDRKVLGESQSVKVHLTFKSF